jgi:hypothetical protein
MFSGIGGCSQPQEPQTWRIHLGAYGARALCDFLEARLESTAGPLPPIRGSRGSRGNAEGLVSRPLGN